MESLPDLAICDAVGGFVCRAEKCNVVVLKPNIVGHLQRKHRMPTSAAKKHADKFIKKQISKQPHPLLYRYLHDPFPKKGEQHLPALPLLPISDVVRCNLCLVYCKGLAACRAHIRSAHVGHVDIHQALVRISNEPLLKAQTLVQGPKKLYFPVTASSESGEVHGSNRTSILFGDDLEEGDSSIRRDNMTVKEKSANLSAKVIGVPEFLGTHEITVEYLYCLTVFEDRTRYSPLVKMLLRYAQHFSEMSPAVPTSVVESIKIRHDKAKASFSLSMEIKSELRYARVVCRFIILAAKLDERTAQVTSVKQSVRMASKKIVDLSERACTTPLLIIHFFLRELLLDSAKSSEGETVSLESMFKTVVAGFTKSRKSEGVRVDDSEDASQTASALQYVCHHAALGEFLLPPKGFGTKRDEEEDARQERVQRMVSTQSCTAGAYVRTILLKTNRISPGECPQVTFVLCNDHAYCGKVNNIEVPLKSNEAGSLGYTVRTISRNVRNTLCMDLMSEFTVPPDFTKLCLSFPDRVNERSVG